ncbi:hypothetical protein NBRC116590_17310 [Pelagimonas sp. KU-00592-HH]|uniref:Hint domain-containing protein n=1 Tax=Pelagimonas sp. KU-00592-HH TaxID=3127651 RepID=UPI00310BCC6F
MPIYYKYDQTLLGTQTTINGSSFNYNGTPPTGGDWSYSGVVFSHRVDEASNSAVNYNGDVTNEVVPNSIKLGASGEQSSEISGTQTVVLYDYTFRVTDGTNSYDIAVIDADLNNDGDVNDPGEDGYYLIFIGDVPPPDTNLTIVGIVDNSTARTHASLGGRVVCFTAGTSLATIQGARLIEELAVGDVVLTLDSGYQSIRWIGRIELPVFGDVAPVEISAGAIGNPEFISVSPQHRMLISDPICEYLFGEREVLIPAIYLLGLPGIALRRSGMVEYFHILFDTHELVLANGCWSESFHPGEQAIRALSSPARNELLALFPELENASSNGQFQVARRSLRKFEAQLLLNEISIDFDVSSARA